MTRITEHRAEVFACIVAAEELLQGWLSFIRRKKAGLGQLEGYFRLQSCLETLHKLTILPFDRDAALMYHRLEKQCLRVGTMDLKIAAICLAHEATLLTRNLLDFEKVPACAWRTG